MNGSKAANGRWPWMGSLWTASHEGCGHVIVASRWVLTAAHCIDGQSAESIQVTYNDSYGLYWTSAKSLYSHPDFRLLPKPDGTDPSFGSVNDIGLVELKKELNFSLPHIRPICLSRTFKETDGDLAWIAGWGAESEK